MRRAAVVAVAFVVAACGVATDDIDGATTTSRPPERSTSTSAPAPSTGTTMPGEGGTLVDFHTFANGPPQSIDPGAASIGTEQQLASLVYDGLTAVDPETGEIVPAVAESWETEGTVWTFRLRSDVTFSDGEPVTSASFAGAWARVEIPDLVSPVTFLFDQIAEVEAPDDTTLQVTTTVPFADLANLLTHVAFSPLPSDALEAADPNQWAEEVMVGNGPFMMDDPFGPTGTTVSRNPDYWGEPALLEEVTFRVAAGATESLAALQSGESDTGAIPPGEGADLGDDFTIDDGLYLGVYHLLVGWDDTQLGGAANLPVRQAISLAIDRESISEVVYDGQRPPATGYTPPVLPGADEGLCELCRYDPDEARQLVAEWGRAASMTPIPLRFNTDGGHEAVMEIVRQNLTEIGLAVELAGAPAETYFTNVGQPGGCGLCRSGWIWDHPSYWSGLAPFRSGAAGTDNLGRYASGTFDDQLAQARSTFDPDARTEAYRAAEQTVLDDVGVIPINWYTTQVAVSSDVQGFGHDPVGLVPYEQVSISQ